MIRDICPRLAQSFGGRNAFGLIVSTLKSGSNCTMVASRSSIENHLSQRFVGIFYIASQFGRGASQARLTR